MFVEVVIERSKEHFVVPIEWVNGLQLAKSVQDGINCNDVCLAFYSKDKTKPSDFGSFVQEKFNENVDCCYIVRPVRYFCKYNMYEMKNS